MRISRLLILSSLALAACTNDPVAPTPRVPAALVLVWEVPPFAPVGTTLSVLARVDDDQGRPIPGVRVVAGSQTAGDQFERDTVVTDADGVARVGWTMGTQVGISRASLSVYSLAPIALEVERRASTFHRLVLNQAGDTLTALPGREVDNGLMVRAVDAFGNGIHGLALTVSVTDGAVPWFQTPTAGDGFAAIVWRTGVTPGIQEITVGVPGTPPTTWQAIVLPERSLPTLAVSQLSSHACRIVPQGGAECWGDNTNGRLGIGSDQPRIGPGVVQGGHDFVAISIGGLNDLQRNGTCAVNLVGEVWCWGAAHSGVPPGIPLRLQISQRFRFIEQGESHVCGLDHEGGAWCWGANASGQLGVGNNVARTAPTRVGGTTTFRDLAVGANHTCGLTRRGQVLCWGLGTNGRLGDGSTTSRHTPAPIASTLRFMTLDVGTAHACAIAIGGGMHCWGSNGNGRIVGDGVQGGAVPLPQAVRPELSFARVTTGVAGTCGIIVSGEGRCWGSNSSHQLADAMRTQLKPTGPMEGAHQWSEIALGESSGCGRTTTGETHCWGFNGDGILGRQDLWRFSTPQPVAGGHLFTDIATGFSHSCGLKGDGSTWCWGNNQVGILGDPDLARAAEPWRVTTVPAFTAITSANNSACGLTVGGSVQCWGAAIVGDGPVENRTIPLSVILPEPATTLHQGWQMGCTTLQSGDVWCWGPGNGNTTPAAAPARVNAPELLAGVSVGIGFACGIGPSGSAYCWNRRTDATAPYPVSPLAGGPTYAVVAVGTNGVCAITGSGTSLCTGAGGVLEPLNPPLPLAWIEPGSYVTCGRTAGAGAVCWGINESGQVGRGDLSEYADPSVVQGSLTWTKLAPGTGHSCGLASGGAAYCWGSAQNGELGNGMSRYFPTPVLVP